MTTRALLFVDHLALGRLAETVLRERGLDLVARDPEAARAALEAQPSPCLIVVAAEGAAALALCLAARSLPLAGCHVILVVTSDGSPERLRALVAMGADDWVVAEEAKFDPEVLGLRIDLALRRLAAPGGDDPLASDETFRLMVETLSEGLGVKNLDGNITYVNARLCQMLGYAREEMLGRPVTDFFDEENLARELVLAPRQLDAAASYEIELTARDGRQIPTLQAPKALYDRTGRRAGSFAVVADLTAQKQVEKELRLTQFLVDRAADAAFWADREARFFYANEAACASLEYSREELLSLRVQDILRPEDSSLFEDVGRAVRAQGPVTFETMHVTRTGRELPVEVTLNCLEWGGRELYCAFARDITERTRAAQALRESEERYHSLFEGVPIGLYRTTPEGRMLDANPALVEILGFPSRETLLRFDVNALYLDPEVRHGWQRELEEEGVVRTFEAQLRRHDGNVIWARCSLQAFRDEEKRILRYEGALEDITGRREAEERLVYETLHDELTGLPNRVLFMDRLRLSMERSRREPERITVVLFLDVDRFKIVNDSLGHLVGDELLVQVAGSLLSVLRPTDTIARMGGDEFAILLEGVRDVSGAEEVASRIHHRLAAPVHLHGHEIYLSASIGIAVQTPEYERAEELLRDADTAMYRAKSQGPAGHVVFNRAMHQFVMARLQLETDLRRAVERGQIEVWYQPVVDLRTGAVTSLEALLRWVHPRHGVIFPDEFLSVAEETGLIVQMGRYVLEESCRVVRELQLRHPEHSELRLSVNLSNKQFFQADLFEQVRHALDESGLDPCCLGLEITEGVIIQHAESAKTRFSRLKSLGIQLSMDDFGKGYSSLNYLHRFPMDVLKIDRSFVSRMEEGAGNLAILEAIVTLAHQLGMEVVAEGIQTAAQVRKIRALGCEYGQGFLFSKPLPAREIDRLLAPAEEPVAVGSSAREFMAGE